MTARVPMALAWVDGSVVEAPTIPADDAAFLTGHGVFEAIEISNGQPFAFDAHLTRLDRSARAVSISVPPREVVAAAVHELFEALGREFPEAHRHAVARITLSVGSPGGPERLVVSWRVWPDRSRPASVLLSRWHRNERSPLAGVKSTSYLDNVLALQEASCQGCDEAILLNSRDELCEGTASNVFVVIDDELVTPPTSSGLLAGVTRDLLLDAGIGRERTVTDDELGAVTEAFLTSTTRHVQPISTWDRRTLQLLGPHTTAARSAWSAIRYS